VVGGHRVQECSIQVRIVSRLALVHQTVDISPEAERTIMARALAGSAHSILRRTFVSCVLSLSAAGALLLLCAGSLPATSSAGSCVRPVCATAAPVTAKSVDAGWSRVALESKLLLMPRLSLDNGFFLLVRGWGPL